MTDELNLYMNATIGTIASAAGVQPDWRVWTSQPGKFGYKFETVIRDHHTVYMDLVDDYKKLYESAHSARLKAAKELLG